MKMLSFPVTTRDSSNSCGMYCMNTEDCCSYSYNNATKDCCLSDECRHYPGFAATDAAWTVYSRNNGESLREKLNISAYYL